MPTTAWWALSWQVSAPTGPPDAWPDLVVGAFYCEGVPFTPAHIAAVLPVVTAKRSWNVPAAWVVGSVVPDFVWFCFGWDAYKVAHSWVGLVTLDLVMGAVVVMLWRLMMLTPLRDLLPRPVGERLPVSRGLPPRSWPWLVVGLVGGAATHVGWDEFAHRGRWGDNHLAFLHERFGPLPGYAWAQYLSGILGVAVVLAVLVRFASIRPPVRVVDSRVPAAARVIFVIAVALVTVTVGVLSLTDLSSATLSTTAGRVLLAIPLATALGCAVWWLMPKRTLPAEPD